MTALQEEKYIGMILFSVYHFWISYSAQNLFWSVV